MNWNSLTVVGIEGLAADFGCAIRSIIVRDHHGRRTVLRGADEASPVLDRVVSTPEFKQLVEQRLWLAVIPGWPAARHKVAFVVTSTFQQALAQAGGPELMGSHALSGALAVVYNDRSVVREFRLQAAQAMLLEARKRLFRDRADPSEVERLLDQARYVCDRNTQHRVELYALYKKLLPGPAWDAIAGDAHAETGLDDSALEVEEARLRASSQVSRRPQR